MIPFVKIYGNDIHRIISLYLDQTYNTDSFDQDFASSGVQLINALIWFNGARAFWWLGGSHGSKKVLSSSWLVISLNIRH